MDVGAPNNLPRLTELFTRGRGVSADNFQAVRISDEDTVRTIKQVYQNTGYLLDPHTAVAWCASEIVASRSQYPDVVVATASPLKFAEEIFEKTGIRIDNTAQLQALRGQPERYTKINNSINELTQFLEENNQS
jgi:threonine synthase